MSLACDCVKSDKKSELVESIQLYLRCYFQVGLFLESFIVDVCQI
jgi:hypothetical protein